ncbi:hypothetical protein ABK040_015505 [Willaertia magna]
MHPKLTAQIIESTTTQSSGLNDDNAKEKEQEIKEEKEEELYTFPMLMNACKFGDLETVKKCLLNKLININQHDPKSIYGVCKYCFYFNNLISNLKHTPLMRAISDGYVEIVDYLLQNGADINRLSWDKDDTTPLHIAIDKRNFEMVRFLLQSGKVNKDNCVNGYGDTAEEYALKKGSTEVAQYIKEFDYNKYLDLKNRKHVEWEPLKRNEEEMMENKEEEGEPVHKKEKVQ